MTLDTPPDGPEPTIIRVVNIHGDAHETSGLDDGLLPLATCESVTRTKNQPREAVISFPAYAYTRDDVHVFTDDTGTGELHEIQVIRGDRVLFWGPAISAEIDNESGHVVLQCRDVMWYFMRRFLDAQRTNELTNPSFETGDTTGWTDEGAVTSSISSDAVRGTHSLQLESSTDLGDIWEQQTVTITGTGIGTLVTFVFYFKIVGSLTGHAKDRRGLYVEARESGNLKTNNFYPIDEATPTGEWIRASTTIPVPANTTWDLQVRLYSPPGTIRWDDGQAVAMQSISTASLTGNTYERVDVAQIVGLIHSFVQNTAFGKSDLNVDLENPDTGVLQVKHIQWADHISWPDQMSEWLDRDDAFDISIRAEIGPPARTLVVHVPEQGTDRRGVTAIAFPGNAGKFHLTEDGGGTVTDATVLDTDTGDGPDREEGHYADPSLIDGLVLQDVESAPTKTEPAGLDPIARDTVKKSRRPAVLIEFTLTNKGGVAYDNLLELNDTMDFGIDYGWASLSGFGKITTMQELPPSRTTVITMLKAEPG